MVRSFLTKPRITISTIHQSKGGSKTNVVLITDMGRLSWEALGTDEEQRVWYVAITRTRKNLFIVRPRGLRHFCNMRKITYLVKMTMKDIVEENLFTCQICKAIVHPIQLNQMQKCTWLKKGKRKDMNKYLLSLNKKIISSEIKFLLYFTTRNKRYYQY